LLKFRHLLEAHNLGAALFAKVGELLQANGVKLSDGTIVDATLIDVPSTTKNREKRRDPEMHSTQKGTQWYFGMKLHIGMNSGTDSRTGLAPHASVTAANVHDSHEAPNLLYGDETRFYGDSAYRGKAQRQRLKELPPRAKDFTNKRAYRNRPLSEADKATNRRKSQVRARVEHPFLVLKRLWGFAKVRYRGLAKNANRAFAMLALVNLVKWRQPLTGEVRPK
jgi:IS5 family transposase